MDGRNPLNGFKTHRLILDSPRSLIKVTSKRARMFPRKWGTAPPDSSYRRQRPILTYTSVLTSYPSR